MGDFTGYYNRRQNGSIKWCDVNVKDKICENIVPMTMADMDFQMSQSIKKAIQKYTETEILGYTKPTANYLLSVQNYFKRHHQFDVQTEWIVTTPGIVNALSTSVRAYTEPGDEVLMMTPVYNPFYEVTKAQGRQVAKCPLLLQNNRYFIDFDRLAELASRQTVKMLLLCSPHNPGGRVWTKIELQKIIKIALANDLVIVSDEIHADLALNGVKHHVLPTVDQSVLDQVVICTAASKTFNIAGLQCSNIIIPNEKMREQFSQENLAVGVHGANALGLVATQTAYAQCDTWLNQVKTVIESHQNLVKVFFEQLDKRFKVMPQDASFLAWINFEDLKLPRAEFLQFLEETCQIFVNDGAMYGDEATYYIRLNVGLPRQALEENLKRFEKQFKIKYQQSTAKSMHL